MVVGPWLVIDLLLHPSSLSIRLNSLDDPEVVDISSGEDEEEGVYKARKALNKKRTPVASAALSSKKRKGPPNPGEPPQAPRHVSPQEFYENTIMHDKVWLARLMSQMSQGIPALLDPENPGGPPLSPAVSVRTATAVDYWTYLEEECFREQMVK